MRIAVTYENGEIFQHFGHTESFKIYEIQDNKVISVAMGRWRHCSETMPSM